MKVTLTRQVTAEDQSILAPGDHDVTDAEAVYYRQMGWTDQAPEKPAVSATFPEPEPVLVEIPEDWTSMHGLQQARLASEIAGRKVTAKQAGEVIRAEIARRNG